MHPPPDRPNRSTSSVWPILAALEQLSVVTLEIDDPRQTASVRAGGWLVAQIDLRRGRVLVNAPADTIPTLERVFPSARATGNGIAFEVDDARDCAEALEAINRRVGVQRLVPQYRDASP